MYILRNEIDKDKEEINTQDEQRGGRVRANTVEKETNEREQRKWCYGFMIEKRMGKRQRERCKETLYRRVKGRALNREER